MFSSFNVNLFNTKQFSYMTKKYEFVCRILCSLYVIPFIFFSRWLNFKSDFICGFVISTFLFYFILLPTRLTFLYDSRLKNLRTNIFYFTCFVRWIGFTSVLFLDYRYFQSCVVSFNNIHEHTSQEIFAFFRMGSFTSFPFPGCMYFQPHMLHHLTAHTRKAFMAFLSLVFVLVHFITAAFPEFPSRPFKQCLFYIALRSRKYLLGNRPELDFRLKEYPGRKQ